ncbi:MAG: serine/threonine-protein kinase, partial [Planctomycetota bacterium]
MDDSSELDLEVAVRVDELASAFAAARTSDPELDPESFADAHPEVPRDALLAVLRGVGVLARARRRSEGPFERGARVGPYEIQEVIGRGGMGIVYEAVETELGRVVALKALDAIRVDERTRARFVREARAAAQLDHAAIVPVFASGETDGVLWYAMRRIQGSSLYELLTSLTADEGEGKTRAREALERAAASGSSSSSASASSLLTARVRAAVGIAAKLADALAYAHASGILHRDIKPANVLLDGSGAPLLTDFGLCKIEDDASLTAANDVVGTLRYMPPEALEGSFDARGDVYSLGLVLYELIAARPAFSSDSRQTMLHQVLRVDPPALGKVAPGVPPDLERVVSKAISKLPEERYATATDFATDLEAVLSGRAVRARPSSALYLARLFVRRNRALSAALALLALVAVAGTVAYVVLLKDANERVRDALSDAQRNEAVARIAGAEATLETDDMLRASALLDDVREEHRGWMWSHLAARVGLGAEPRALGLLDTRQAIENDDQSLLCVYGGGGLVALERNGLREIDRLEGNFLSGAFGGDGRDFYLVQWRPCALVHARIEEERIVTRTVRDLEQNELMLAALEGSDAVFVRSGLNALKVVDASTNELMWERTFPIQEYNVFDALSETEVILGLRGGEFYHLKRDVERPDQVSNHVGNASALLVRDGEVLATGGDDGSVQLHSALTGHTDAWFVLNGAVASISYDHAGTGLVAVTTWDRTVALIRPETACVERILSGFDAIPVGASFGAEPWLVSATAGAELSAHERTDHDGRVELTPALGDLLSLGSSPDGRLLAGYGDERVFYVHDLEDLSVRYTAIDTRDESSTPSFDADGSLVSLGRVVLDAETLEARHVIQLEDALVRSAFAEDGALFAVGLASDPKARDA